MVAYRHVSFLITSLGSLLCHALQQAHSNGDTEAVNQLEIDESSHLFSAPVAQDESGSVAVWQSMVVDNGGNVMSHSNVSAPAETSRWQSVVVDDGGTVSPRGKAHFEDSKSAGRDPRAGLAQTQAAELTVPHVRGIIMSEASVPTPAPSKTVNHSEDGLIESQNSVSDTTTEGKSDSANDDHAEYGRRRRKRRRRASETRRRRAAQAQTSADEAIAPPPPPVNCKWTDWSEWDDCSASCGVGVVTRSRDIAKEKSNGGKPCRGRPNATMPCDAPPCPVAAAPTIAVVAATTVAPSPQEAQEKKEGIAEETCALILVGAFLIVVVGFLCVRKGHNGPRRPFNRNRQAQLSGSDPFGDQSQDLQDDQNGGADW